MKPSERRHSKRSTDRKRNRGIAGYEPVISVCTRRKRNNLEIHIKENGEGIQGKIKSKIFQPFFTTKPAGEGIGLGLSLSYDIVKMRGSELKVNNRQGEGAEFIMQLPLTSAE